MSMLGIFGLCSQESFNKLAAAGGQAEAAEICREMEVSGQELENSSCSGEVFVALFQYLKAAFDVDVRKNAAPLGAGWRSLTGDYDMAVFTEAEKALLLPLADKLDQKGLDQFVSEFFQLDYGDAGRMAWAALSANLARLTPDKVLVWRLC